MRLPNAITALGRDRRARFLGRLPDGRRVSRYTVRVVRNERAASPHAPLDDMLASGEEVEVEVLAASPADAANLVRDEWAPHEPCVEVLTWGPKGGCTSRFVGWESHIGAVIAERHRRARQGQQLALDV